MQYTTIQQLFYELTKTNPSSVPAATLNLYTQPAENRVVSLIMSADGRWQYDDSNRTDFPIGKGNLVSGQQDYTLSTDHIRFSGAAVLTNAGLWQRLLPFDPEDLKVHFSPLIDRAQFFSTPGRPLFYDKLGTSLILYPAPDNGISVTLTAGLKIYFERGGLNFDWTIANGGSYASYTAGQFNNSTGNYQSSPGWNQLYHDLIAYWAAYNYCVANTLPMAAGYMAEIQTKEVALLSDYEQRDKDERQILTMSPIRYR